VIEGKGRKGEREREFSLITASTGEGKEQFMVP